MLLPIYVALVVASIFYVVLPVVGGYWSRAQWRRFRERLVQLSLAPRLSLGAWATQRGEATSELPGRYRLYGSMEAIEGENRIWIRSERVTATVDLGRSAFHILANERGSEISGARAALVERLPWSRVRVFPEGAKVFVGGAVRIEGGKPVFAEAPAEPLIVVSYEGTESTLLSRLIAGGRRDNEYWNPLSRVSLALGIGVMGIFLAIILRGDWFPTVIFLSLLIALTPALPLLPPGLPLFFGYLHFWRKALADRTIRDLLRLPLRYFVSGESVEEDGGRSAPLPEGGRYLMKELSGPPDEGVDKLVPRSRHKTERWIDFSARDSDDPAARHIAIAGDPEVLAAEYDRSALWATLASGLSLAFGLTINFVIAFVLWRLV